MDEQITAEMLVVLRVELERQSRITCDQQLEILQLQRQLNEVRAQLGRLHEGSWALVVGLGDAAEAFRKDYHDKT